MDWGEGSYERTAATLVAAATKAIAAAGIGPGARVLDLGAGTGNAALEAARRGAEVIAVEPSPRLVEVCDARARSEGLRVDVRRGDASAIPCDDASRDVVVSVFAVIFAPDAERATDEMLRVLSPGGRVVLTSWVPAGPIAAAGRIVVEALTRALPAPTTPRPTWGDPAFVRDVFARRGATASLVEETLVFEAASPEGWFAEQEEHHPFWRFTRKTLAPAEWDAVRDASVTALRDGNEVATGFRTTSRYLLVTATKARA